LQAKINRIESTTAPYYYIYIHYYYYKNKIKIKKIRAKESQLDGRPDSTESEVHSIKTYPPEIQKKNSAGKFSIRPIAGSVAFTRPMERSRAQCVGNKH
jgi:hypothetical protein